MEAGRPCGCVARRLRAGVPQCDAQGRILMIQPPPLHGRSAGLSACDSMPLPCAHRVPMTMARRGSSPCLTPCGWSDAHFRGSQWHLELLKFGRAHVVCRVCGHQCGELCGVKPLRRKAVRGVRGPSYTQARGRARTARRTSCVDRARVYRSPHTPHTPHNAVRAQLSSHPHPAQVTAHPAHARSRVFSYSIS